MKELEHMDPERVREEKERRTDRRAWWTSSRSPWRRCQWRCRGGGVPAGWSYGGSVVLPAAGSATLWIGLGLGQWGCGGGETRTLSRLPHLLFIGTVRRGPTSQ